MLLFPLRNLARKGLNWNASGIQTVSSHQSIKRDYFDINIFTRDSNWSGIFKKNISSRPVELDWVVSVWGSTDGIERKWLISHINGLVWDCSCPDALEILILRYHLYQRSNIVAEITNTNVPNLILRCHQCGTYIFVQEVGYPNWLLLLTDSLINVPWSTSWGRKCI